MTVALRNITRVDHGRTAGWWVRIYRDKVCHSKLFSDGIYGTRAKALRAAKAWRDRALRKLPRPARASRPPVDAGWGYVRRTDRLRRVDVHPVWSAWLRIEEMRCKSTSYSVTLWGELGAKRRAEAWLRRERRALRKRIRAA